MFEGLRGEFRWHLRSRHRGPKSRSGDTWAEGLLRWFKGDSVEHLSVTLDGLGDCGVRYSPLALVFESGSAEVAEDGMDPSGYCCSLTTPSPSC